MHSVLSFPASFTAVCMPTSLQDDDTTFNAPLTREDLLELERAPRTSRQIFMDYFICFSPILAGGLALLEYLGLPNLQGNQSTQVYVVFIAGLIRMMKKS